MSLPLTVCCPWRYVASLRPSCRLQHTYVSCQKVADSNNTLHNNTPYNQPYRSFITDSSHLTNDNQFQTQWSPISIHSNKDYINITSTPIPVCNYDFSINHGSPKHPTLSRETLMRNSLPYVSLSSLYDGVRDDKVGIRTRLSHQSGPSSTTSSRTTLYFDTIRSSSQHPSQLSPQFRNVSSKTASYNSSTFLQQSRTFSTSKAGCSSSRSAGLHVFDRNSKLLQRERAAGRPDAPVYDYLKDEVGYRLSNRIFDIKQEFDVGLDLGCGRGHLAKNITDATMKKLYMSDLSPALLDAAVMPDSPGLVVEKKTIDEEQPLPFASASLDIVLSNLSLHWVNNLPGCLREVHRSLKADGVVLASMFGGDTLYQLRSSLLLAEMEREGGMSAHVSPFTEVQDIGSLLTNAGFTMLTVDTEDITVGYPSMFELIHDLQGMAENNANLSRKLHLPRDTLMAAAAIYQEMYGLEEGIPATFQIIYMIGWKPNPDRIVSPAARGSGKVSLKDLGRLDEMVKESGMQGKLQFIEDMTNTGERGDKGDNGNKGDK